MSEIDLGAVRAQVEILRFCKQKKAELKELEEQARAAVEAQMGDASVGVLDGVSAVGWSRFKRRALNQKALKAAHPEVFENFVETSEIRRFEVFGDE